ncbi:MAG: undecaprenyl-diphosphate phosphatase [Deltaproteobacteria bacterium]|jgi:undecaprenyl-diphosphatase|nr:undecaprenyl-diphosphate phosphatase [Deltaproteobacteria bacterium]
MINNELLSASLLGLVQGITEFLPVSSTGHLILTSSLLGLHGDAIKTFEVFIQLGSILAVLVLYRQRFIRLLLPGSAAAGNVSKTESPTDKSGGGPQSPVFAGLYGLWLLFLTCLPAGLLGFFAHSLIKTYLFNPLTVALALAAGAILMLLLERCKRPARVNGLDQLTPKLALGIGFCQCLSLWPGFSRSASTIMGGMWLGADRKTAAEYSFIAAVPIMFAATAFDLFKNWGGIGSEHIAFFAVGFLVSFLAALAAIKIFIGLVGRIGLAPFAWYRLALAPLVYWFFW